MINPLYALLFALILLISNYLSFGYGLRLGKALQKEIPSVPLAVTVEKAAGIVKRIGKRTIRLVTDMKELKALKKGEKEEINVFD